jgi:DNA-binding transcriptional ArsR family regulator
MSDATTSHAASGRGWGYAGALLGGLVSIAANVAHSYVPPAGAAPGWRPPLGDVVEAVFWPIALFVAIEILARTAWPHGARWVVVRFLGLLPVAVVAAIVSYGHLSGLLGHYGESTLTAHLGPLAVDGLMVMASSALMATAPGRSLDAATAESIEADTTPDIVADSTPDIEADAAPVAKRKRARTTASKPKRTGTAAKTVALAAKHPELTTVELAKKLGITDRTVRRHLNAPSTDATTSPVSAEASAPVLAPVAA